MIVGVDVSSKRIDLAWLENGKPQRWHQELAKGHLIDRLRSINVRWPHLQLPAAYYPHCASDVTDIAIEMPFGQSRSSIGALMAVTGIVTRQAPKWARVAWPSSGELRAAIGARNTKQSAHDALWDLDKAWAHVDYARPVSVAGWNEHECDALVACLGWGAILARQDAECTP